MVEFSPNFMRTESSLPFSVKPVPNRILKQAEYWQRRHTLPSRTYSKQPNGSLPRPARGVDYPSLFSGEVKERVELWSVLGRNLPLPLPFPSAYAYVSLNAIQKSACIFIFSMPTLLLSHCPFFDNRNNPVYSKVQVLHSSLCHF